MEISVPVSALADRDGAGSTRGKAEQQPVTIAESCVPGMAFFPVSGGHSAQDRARSPINSMHPVEREFCSHAILHPSSMELGLACLACSLVREIQALKTMDVVG